jgi:hypothetical protein
MIDLHKVHERELFDVSSAQLLSWDWVGGVLEAHGFKLEDDHAFLLRTRSERWQALSLLSCSFVVGEKAVYPDESDFESIRFSVLVASLPPQEVLAAISTIYLIADALRLPVLRHGSPIEAVPAVALAKCWLEEIRKECGDDSGSESVAILVEMAYAKKMA